MGLHPVSVHINVCGSGKERRLIRKLGVLQVGSVAPSENLLEHLTLLFLLPATRLDVINVILLYRLLQLMQRCSPVDLVKVFIHKVRHLQVLGFSRNGIAQGPITGRERLR